MAAYAVIDLETRSVLDLPTVGVHAYAEHETTSPWCMAWCLDDGPIHIWRPGGPDPEPLLEHICDGRYMAHWDNGGEVVAHNALFELTMWNWCIRKRIAPHWPPLHPEQMNCTMARCNAVQLPPGLLEAGMTIGLPVQKDLEGHRLMLQMCRPRKIEPDGTIRWWDHADKMQRLEAYCAKDTEVERLMHKRLLPLSDTERQVWVLDARINERGIRFDLPNVSRAHRIIEAELQVANARMSAATGGIVPAVTNTQALAKFVKSRGVECTSVDKEHIEELLDADLPTDVREALELRQVTGKSSVAKIPAIFAAVNSDGRARGMYTYAGAAQTGRWAGRRVQPQNLPRVEDFSQQQIETAIDALHHDYARDLITCAYGEPLDVLSQCLRAMIVPEKDHELIGGDYSQIEARVLPWLADEDWLLEAFREFDTYKLGADGPIPDGKGGFVRLGPDIYKLTYARAYDIDVADITAYQRTLGKPMRLALGYGGGFGAFRGMAKSYKIKIVESDPTGQYLDRPKVEGIKTAFRESNPYIQQFWHDLDDTAKRAITCREHRVYTVPQGSISYRRVGSYLFCQLPSGRCLSYVKPRVQWVDKKWPDGSKSRIQQIVYYGQDPETSRFTDLHCYGGKLSAHVTQATARDILARCMLRLEANGYSVVLHSHDEPVSEVECGRADTDEYRQLMLEREDWMGALPIAASKPWVSDRYVKG